ncbi:hypothetical protein [Streptomyces sp. NPDC047130]|uniref:hypothetical protein n=1 Tax=Streptomyces sp. NPDC047130 TaxID=3155261 RepID=UPI0033EE4E22
MTIASFKAPMSEPNEPPEIYADPVRMERDTPAKVEPDTLQRDLRRMGLGCELTEKPYLQRFINEVRQELPSSGRVQAVGIGLRDPSLLDSGPAGTSFVDTVLSLSAGGYADMADVVAEHEGVDAFFEEILQGNPGGQAMVNAMADAEWGTPGFVKSFARNDPRGIVHLAELARAGVKLVAATTWKWHRDDETGRVTRSDLAELAFPERWDRLHAKGEKQHRSRCRKGDQPERRWAVTTYSSHEYRKDLADATAIKKLYRTMGGNLTSAVAEGVDTECVEAALSNALAFLQDSSFSDQDFDSWSDKRNPREVLVFLVHEPAPEDVQGVGVVSVQWRLRVEKFRDKKQEAHPTKMEFWVRTALYPSVYDDSDPRSRRTLLSNQTSEDLRLVN